VRLTNDCYLVTLHAGAGVEHYFRDGPTWIKLSTRGRRFEATAEQVLNHLLPALAGVKPGVTATVEHRDMSESAAQTPGRGSRPGRPCSPPGVAHGLRLIPSRAVPDSPARSPAP
jgi:hypothetical protein